MSNSKLVVYTKLSPHCTKPRQGKIKGISIHTMAGPGSVEGCGQVFQTSEASSHYGIGPDGRIGQYVLEENRAWCCSHKVDHEVVTIEVSSIQSYKEPYECTAAAFKSLIDLCVDICQRNGIKELIWKEGRQYCPAFTGNWAVCNMVPHRYTTDKGKSCPGNYLFGKYGEIAERVNARLKGEDEDMDINKLLSEMTNEQAYELVKKAEIYAATLPDDDWSKKEGWWEKAQEAGVSDGTSPVRHMKRNEVVAILGRLGLLK
ncbi:N-acetylmuramoyl-L-alanine amidase [Evtepia sp.]|uniref:peptidoglycan recognition protein family protein n=1 Tax=Evtepia sp. TaxID=2773933 RepID=UPI003990AF29